jgi:hypothetical protein
VPAPAAAAAAAALRAPKGASGLQVLQGAAEGLLLRVRLERRERFPLRVVATEHQGTRGLQGAREFQQPAAAQQLRGGARVCCVIVSAV